ncbi:MAG: hypothetical protein BGP14_17095 [Sphingobacteriales bacterium 44-15]|nr:MAG: hypothetical protein BGP14_17095 [Sphingobacteriales bacterium 44-15]
MKQFWQLLYKYRSGNSDRGDPEDLLHLLEENRQELYEDLKSEFDQSDNDKSIFLREDAAERIRRNILERIASDVHQKQRYAFAIRRNWRFAGKAACVLLLVFATQMWTKRQSHKEIQFTKLAVLAVGITEKKIENTGKTVLLYTLPDGSLVKLSPGSFISYEPGFNDRQRNIQVSGKALFDVAKDTAKPFIVFAGNISTRAVGTVFSVSTLNDSNTVVVELLEGKVVIQSSKYGSNMKKIALTAGHQCTISLFEDKALVTTLNIAKPVAPPVHRTPSAELAFEKRPLKNVFDALSKRFNVTINYNRDDINHLSFTGTFAAGDSLDMILTVLCNTNDLLFENNGTNIIIKK